MNRRVERWARGGFIADIDVDDLETVTVAYPVLADMLTQLGFTRQQAERTRADGD